MDTSGKDGTVKHVFGTVNPAGVQVTSFKKPTRAELRHDFLWRVHTAPPAPGESASSTAATTRTCSWSGCTTSCPKSWKQRYEHINDFEQLLADEGTAREVLPAHQQGGAEGAAAGAAGRPDQALEVRAGRRRRASPVGRLRAAYADAIAKCSTEYAPWYVVPADRKWYRDFAVTSLLVEALTAMAPEYPPAGYDVEEQRARVLAT